MELDRLQIKIDANAAQANRSINNLIKKLLTLSTNLGSVDTGKLNNIASGIKSISDASAGFKGKSGKASEITSLANALKKFSNIDTTSLYGISSAMKNLSSGIGSIGSVNVTGMTNLISSISKLGGKNATQGAKNLITVKDDLVKFVQGMNSIGNLNFNTAGLSNLISSISRLGLKSTTQATKNLPTMSAQLQNFVRQMNNIGSSTFDTSTLLNLANAISRLGGKNVTQSIVNLPLLTKELANLFNALAKVPAVNQNVINMTNSLAKLASTGSKSGSAVRSLSGSLNSYHSSATKAAKSSKGLVSQIGMFYARFFLAVRGVKQFWKSIESSMNYVEVLNYFNAAFGQVAENAVGQWKEAGYDSAEAYYDSFTKRAEQLTQKMTGYSVSESGMLTATGTKNMGINPSELMNYQAMFGQMSSSMGIASENALTLSNVLTEIGADLASVKNMDFNKVWEDMASGLAGMSRTLDKYGVNIRNVNLQTKLNELGIQANITALNQNEKALLRTIILLDSTKYAWGDLSDTINQPANQLRLLRSNFSNLARTIGNIFLPIVANVLPYLNGLAIALQRVAENIVKMLGFKDFDWGGLGGTKGASDSISNIYDEADNTSDALDNATDSAKELKNQLMSFDEVDKLTEPTESTSSTKTGSGLDAAGSAALDKAFQDAASAYQKAWDEAFANMEQKSTDIANKITKVFSRIADAATPTKKALQNLWNDGLKKLTNFSGGALNDFYKDFLVPVGKWTLGTGIPKLIDALNDFLNKIKWNKLRKNLDNFWKGIEPFVEGFGDGLIKFFKGITNIGATVINLAGDAIGGVGKILINFGGENVKKAGEVLATALSGIFTGLVLYKSLQFVATLVMGWVDAFKKFSLIFTTGSGILLAASIIFGIASALANLIRENKHVDIEISANVQEALDDMQKAIEKYDEVKENFSSKLEDVDSEYSGIETIANKYFELSSNYDNLTESEKELLSFYSSELQKALPEINGYINEQTNAFTGSKEELNAIIDKTKEYYKLEATKEYLVEAYKTQAKLKKQLDEYTSKVNESVKKENELRDAYKKSLSVYEESGTVFSRVFDSIGGFATGTYSKAKEASDKAYEAYATAKKESEALIDSHDEVLKKYEESIADIDYWEQEVTDAYQNQSKSIEEYSKSATKTFENEKRESSETAEQLIKDSEKTYQRTSQIHGGISKSFSDTTNKMVSDSAAAVNNTNANFSNLLTPSLNVNTAPFVQNSANAVNSTNDLLRTSIFSPSLSVNTSNFSNSVYNVVNYANNSLAGIKTTVLQMDTSDAMYAVNKFIGGVKDGLSKIDFNMKLLKGDTTPTETLLGLSLIPQYATGGFPEDGMFFANHNELVGQFSNGKTAVANNDQITAGIERAAYNGMKRALAESNGKQSVNISLEANTAGLFKAVQKEADNYTRRTGESAFVF